MLNRVGFKFWLNVEKDDELLLCEDIDTLKRQKLFTRTIREGIRLIMELRQNRVDLLLTLFPNIENTLRARFAPPPPDNADLKAELKRFTELLVRSGVPPTVSAPINPIEPMPSIFAKPDKADAAATRRSFADGMGNLFEDDEDDLLLQPQLGRL